MPEKQIPENLGGPFPKPNDAGKAFRVVAPILFPELFGGMGDKRLYRAGVLLHILGTGMVAAYLLGLTVNQ